MKQIFISYRREGGESLAHLIYDRLTHHGYDVFLDVESLRSGDFNMALLTKIEECEDFILILPPNALDRCVNPQDWVRLEIEHAIKHRKNIIPVLLRNFVFPENLPESLQALKRYNGLTANMEYFDAMITRLEEKLLISKPRDTQPVQKTRISSEQDTQTDKNPASSSETLGLNGETALVAGVGIAFLILIVAAYFLITNGILGTIFNWILIIAIGIIVIFLVLFLVAYLTNYSNTHDPLLALIDTLDQFKKEHDES